MPVVVRELWTLSLQRKGPFSVFRFVGNKPRAKVNIVYYTTCESRWRNPHVLVYHGPLQIATFWELRHPLSLRCRYKCYISLWKNEWTGSVQVFDCVLYKYVVYIGVWHQTYSTSLLNRVLQHSNVAKGIGARKMLQRPGVKVGRGWRNNKGERSNYFWSMWNFNCLYSHQVFFLILHSSLWS